MSGCAFGDGLIEVSIACSVARSTTSCDARSREAGRKIIITLQPTALIGEHFGKDEDKILTNESCG
jgi:hypothetical protein